MGLVVLPRAAPAVTSGSLRLLNHVQAHSPVAARGGTESVNYDADSKGKITQRAVDMQIYTATVLMDFLFSCPRHESGGRPGNHTLGWDAITQAAGRLVHRQLGCYYRGIGMLLQRDASF